MSRSYLITGIPLESQTLSLMGIVAGRYIYTNDLLSLDLNRQQFRLFGVLEAPRQSTSRCYSGIYVTTQILTSLSMFAVVYVRASALVMPGPLHYSLPPEIILHHRSAL